MAVPTQVQLFNAFLGTQEGTHSVILPDVFSSGGSYNLWIDKYGRAKKIEGYTKQNASPVLTNTGGSPTLLRSLFPYRKTSGGSTTRQLVGVFDDEVNEWEIHTSTDDGASWTFRYDAGSSAVGQLADFAQFGDDLYITNGKVSPRLWDGTTLSAAVLTQSPTPSSAAGSGSGVLNGNYQWKLVATYADGTRKPGSAASTVLALQNERADLTWTADADTNVVGYEIYRTSGTGLLYYYVGYSDDRTVVAYTDNLSDTTLIERRALLEHGDAPATTYFCEPHKQRMWWLKTDANPARAWWSDAGAPMSVYGENYLDFTDHETAGDTITGAFGNFAGQLVVFTEKAVWTVSGSGAVDGRIVDLNRVRSNAQAGCVSHRSVVKVPAGVKYSDQNGETQVVGNATLAYFTPKGDIRLFDGLDDLIISHPIVETLATLQYSERRKVFALHDSVKQQISWYLPTGSSNEPNKAVTWNYKWGVWYVWEDQNFSSGVEMDASDSATQRVVGSNATSTGGYAYLLDSGNTFDGTPYSAAWMTKALRGVRQDGESAFSFQKTWRWADFLFEVNQGTELLIEWFPATAADDAVGIANKLISSDEEFLYDATPTLILTADGDTMVLALSSAQSKVLLKGDSGDYLYNEGIRLRISDNFVEGVWAIEAFALAYQILPGQGRRVQ